MKNNRIKAVMFDKMQYSFSKYYDRMIHCYIIYEGKVDKEKLKNSFSFLLDEYPILHSHYKNRMIRSYWKIQKDIDEDYLTFLKTDDCYKEALSFLTEKPFNIKKEYQIKIQVAEEKERFSIALIINHMVLDGGDLKFLLSQFTSFYNSQETVKRGKSRSHMNIYKDMDEGFKKKALSLYKNMTSDKPYQLNLTKKSKEDRQQVSLISLEKDESMRIISYCKNNNCTVTDVFLACYGFSSLKFLKTEKKKRRFSLQSMVDLRRYVNSSSEIGISNQTGVMNISFDVDSSLEEIIRQIKVQTKIEKDNYIGLYSLPLLALDYKLFIDCIANLLIKIFFNLASFTLSNIGILDKEKLSLDGCLLKDAHIYGASRKKNKSVLSITSLDDCFTFSFPFIGNSEDKKIIDNFLEEIKKNLLSLV